MAPRTQLLRASKQIAMQFQSGVAYREAAPLQLVSRRGYADEKTPKEERATGPNQDVLGHVSEEAAAVGKVTGETQPDLNQGTSVQEILKRDQAGQDSSPNVLKEDIAKGIDEAVSTSTDNSSASFKARSTHTPDFNLAQQAILRAQRARAHDKDILARLRAKITSADSPLPPPPKTKTKTRSAKATAVISAPEPVRKERGYVKWGENYFGKHQPGLRHEDLSKTAFPKTSKLQKRYEPIVDQVTKLLMRHGKLSVAQRNMATILNHLRTTPPPTPNPNRPFVPGTPPASHLPLNPILYLTTAIDSVAPLIRIKTIRGGAGGGQALALPLPIQSRQRRRTAVMWILDVINKKPSRGSGKNTFATKFAEEVVAVAEGRSSVWDRRGAVHKLAAGARANKVRAKGSYRAF